MSLKAAGRPFIGFLILSISYLSHDEDNDDDDEDNDDDVEENTDDTATRLGWAAEHRPLVVLKCKIETAILELSSTPKFQTLDGIILGCMQQNSTRTI